MVAGAILGYVSVGGCAEEHLPDVTQEVVPQAVDGVNHDPAVDH